MKLLFTIIIFLIPSFIFGQILLKGKVSDSTHNRIFGANIILLNSENNSIQDGTITNEDGVFNFANVEKGSYRVEISYLGFETFEKQIKIEKDYDMGTIILKEIDNLLDEVVIRAEGKKPIIEMRKDRTIFNVSQSDASIGGNAIDALRVTPGIQIKNSAINLVGKGAVKLMIDDQMVRLSGQSAFEYLKSIPSENIGRIEMITNPPAKYSAEGSYGIINVVLKKGQKDHFYGIVSASGKKSKRFSHSENASVFYQKDKLQINGGVNYYDSRSEGYFDNHIFYDDYTLKEHNDFLVKSHGYGAFAELGYELSNKTKIGLNFRYFKNPKNQAKRNDQSDFIRNHQIDSTLSTKSNQIEQSERQNYSLYLDHKLDTLGSTMSIEASYIHKDGNDNLNFTTANTITAHQDNVISNSTEKSNLFYGAVDFSFNRDFANYNFGGQVQTSAIKSNSAYNSNAIDAQNSRFHYNEQVYSAYISASKDFNEKWGFKLGLRAEYTESKGNSLTLEEITKRDYLELFPTAYISYNLNENNAFVLSYGRRIDRPMYSYLDPFREYFSTISYREGNPYLRPAYNNNFELKHIFKNKLSSGIFFSYVPNGYGELTIANNDSPVVAQIRDNYLKTYKYGLVESLYLKPFSWWESNNEGRIYYSKSTSKNPNTRPRLEGFGAYVNTNNSFYFNSEKTFQANLNFNYFFPEVDGVDKYKSFYEFDVGFTGIFFDKQLALSLHFNDIFKTSLIRSTTVTNHIPQHFKGFYDSQSIRFSATYKFGNKKNKKERNINDDNQDRI